MWALIIYCTILMYRLAEQLVLHLRALQMLTLAFHMAASEFRDGVLKPTKAAKKRMRLFSLLFYVFPNNIRATVQRMHVFSLFHQPKANCRVVITLGVWPESLISPVDKIIEFD